MNLLRESVPSLIAQCKANRKAGLEGKQKVTKAQLVAQIEALQAQLAAQSATVPSIQ